MSKLKEIQEVLDSGDKALRLGLFEAQRHRDKTTAPEVIGYKCGEAALYTWEYVENGSISDMISAYKHVFGTDDSIREPLSIEIIDEIRSQMKKAMSYGNDELKEIGLNTLYTEKLSRPRDLYADFRSFSIPCGDNDEIINRVEGEGKQLKRELLDRGYLAGNEEVPYDVVKSTGEGRVRAAAGSARVYYQAVISRYNKEIEATSSIAPSEEQDDRKLGSIIKLARDLERIHPYADFNCRTFCVLVLNRELVKNNLSPSLMEDPNVFDYQSLGELKKSVVEGQRNFEHLQVHGVAHEHDPTNEEWRTYSTKTTIEQLEKDEKEARIEIEDDEMLEKPNSVKSSNSSERSEGSEVGSQRSEETDTTKRSNSSDKTSTSAQSLDSPLSLGEAAALPKKEKDTPEAKQKIQQPSVDPGKSQIMPEEAMVETDTSQQNSSNSTTPLMQNRLDQHISLDETTALLSTRPEQVILQPSKGSSRPQIRPPEGVVNKELGLDMIDLPFGHGMSRESKERMSQMAAAYGVPTKALGTTKVLAPKPTTTQVSSTKSTFVADTIRYTLTRNSQRSVRSSSTKTPQLSLRRTPQKGLGIP